MNRQDLVALVRQVQAGSGLSDPRDVAGKVLAQIPADLIREALELTLPEFCRVAMSQERMAVRGSRPNANTKASMVRSWYQRFLAQSVDVTGKGTWKQLGQCTVDDVLALAAQRREQAAKSAAVADQFEWLAQEMRRARAKTVAKLPASTLQSGFGEAAA